MGDRETIHASTVAIEGRAVMIVGASGAGKSDLALRLIDRGATLVSDDYTEIVGAGGTLAASAPATIRGQIEVRGLGIVPMPWDDAVPVALAVRVDVMPERMPERRCEIFGGVSIPVMALDPRAAAAPLIVELALRHDLP